MNGAFRIGNFNIGIAGTGADSNHMDAAGIEIQDADMNPDSVAGAENSENGSDSKPDESSQKEESSAEIRDRVNRARAIQTERFKGTGVTCNAKMTPRLTRKFCVLSPEADALLKQSFDSLGLSPRAYDKILRISRTIADLEGSESIELSHVAEAIQYRSLDRKYWR